MKSLKAYTIHEKYRAALLGLANDLRQYNFLCQEEEDLRRIADNLRAPFNIAVFGRMKAGKSSLINAIIGQKLTITDTEEATATINRLSYATGDRLKTFTIHWQHCQPEDRPLSELETEWSGKASKVLENVGRAAWLELYSDAEALRNIHITDTPGTGSTACVLLLKGLVSAQPVCLNMMGGLLKAEVEQTDGKVTGLWLIGDTNVVAEGVITDEDLIL